MAFRALILAVVLARFFTPFTDFYRLWQAQTSQCTKDTICTHPKTKHMGSRAYKLRHINLFETPTTCMLFSFSFPNAALRVRATQTALCYEGYRSVIDRRGRGVATAVPLFYDHRVSPYGPRFSTLAV
jgi:hypothetical protein